MELIKAQQLAEKLIHKHDLDVKGWRFSFDNARRRFGCCKYRSKQITLSKVLTLLNNEKEVKNTILHEIAHALTPGHHHDWVWRQKAIEIGCDGSRCYSSKIVATPEPRYVATCVGCGKQHSKNRLSKWSSSSCRPCSGGRRPTPRHSHRCRGRPGSGIRARGCRAAAHPPSRGCRP